MEENHLIAERKRKLEELKKAGINPFAYHYDKKEGSSEVVSNFEKYEGKDVSVAGRIVSMRDMGKICFMHIQDSMGKIQVYLSKDELG
jgi:lysyl-tRNA synthetase, class II